MRYSTRTRRFPVSTFPVSIVRHAPALSSTPISHATRTLPELSNRTLKENHERPHLLHQHGRI